MSYLVELRATHDNQMKENQKLNVKLARCKAGMCASECGLMPFLFQCRAGQQNSAKMERKPARKALTIS